MKQFPLFLFFCALQIPNLWSQQTFTLTPNPVYGTDEDDFILVGQAMVKNLAATTDTFRWKRTVIRLDNDSLCFTNVSDPYIDWFHAVSERTFVLEPGQEGPLYVTLYDFEETGCCAIIQMKLKKLDPPLDSIEATYYFRTCSTLSIAEAQKSSVEVFPNPVAQYFGLQNAAAVSWLTLCDAGGKMLKRMQVNAENRYGMTELPSGVYFLVLENKHGGILQVLELAKE